MKFKIQDYPLRFFFKTLIGPSLVAILFVTILFFSIQLTWQEALSLLCFSTIVHFVFTLRLTQQYRLVLNIVRRVMSTHTKLNLYEEDDAFEESEYFEELERFLSLIRRKTFKLQRQSQFQNEELQAFINATQDAILILNENQKVSFYNSQFSKSFLQNTQLSDQGLLLTQIFRSPELLSGFDQVINTKKLQRCRFEIHDIVEKISRYYIVNIYPLHNNQVVGLFHDVTELVRADKVRIDFVTNASHELRTPLTSIKGYLLTMASDIKDERFDSLGQFNDVALKNVNRLENLVNDLLSLSMLESHNIIKKDWVSTDQVSHSVFDQVKQALESKNQKIIFSSKVEKVFADMLKLEQVMLNLIINANKYIPNDKIIEVRWEKNHENDILLIIKDNGPGIAQEHLPRIFERFYRVDPSRARESGGTGIGLSIVKHIMSSHGGSIEVKSTLGQGCEFICKFVTEK